MVGMGELWILRDRGEMSFHIFDVKYAFLSVRMVAHFRGFSDSFHLAK